MAVALWSEPERLPYSIVKSVASDTVVMACNRGLITWISPMRALEAKCLEPTRQNRTRIVQRNTMSLNKEMAA